MAKAVQGHLESLVDLDVANLKSLIAAAQAELEAKLHAEKENLANSWRQQAAKLGLKPEEILGIPGAQHKGLNERITRTRKGKIGSSPIKYRDPTTGNEWVGLGRKPAWVLENERKGVSIEDFRIEPTS